MVLSGLSCPTCFTHWRLVYPVKFCESMVLSITDTDTTRPTQNSWTAPADNHTQVLCSNHPIPNFVLSKLRFSNSEVFPFVRFTSDTPDTLVSVSNTPPGLKIIFHCKDYTKKWKQGISLHQFRICLVDKNAWEMPLNNQPSTFPPPGMWFFHCHRSWRRVGILLECPLCNLFWKTVGGPT